MKETPILFTPDHIRAILDDKKTQTRRVWKKQPYLSRCNPPNFKDTAVGDLFICPDRFPTKDVQGTVITECTGIGNYHCMGAQDFVEKHGPRNYGVCGDRLWVRERYTHSFRGKTPDACHYLADAGTSRWLQAYSREHALASWPGQWKNAMFMPKWAARLWLEITDVRVERVQEISGHDSFAEGVTVPCLDEEISKETLDELAIAGYKYLWDSINGKRVGGVFAWDKNPFVWALTFKRIEV